MTTQQRESGPTGGPEGVIFPTLTPRVGYQPIPRRYEETKLVVNQEFTHRKILGRLCWRQVLWDKFKVRKSVFLKKGRFGALIRLLKPKGHCEDFHNGTQVAHFNKIMKLCESKGHCGVLIWFLKSGGCGDFTMPFDPPISPS